MSFQHEDLPKDHDHATASGSNGPSGRLIAAIALAVVILIFIIANDHETKIKFVVFTWDTTVRWSIFIALLLGVALDRLLIWGLKRRKAAKVKTDKKVKDER